MTLTMELCLDDIAGVDLAARAGMARVELVANLAVGGTTPSLGVIETALETARERIGVHIMVRPRPGEFVYSSTEFSAMLRDVDRIANLARTVGGEVGVVAGVLLPDGRIDVARMRAIVDAAGGLPVTIHKSFDLTPDLHEALDATIASGVGRVLTSGGRANLLDGAATLANLVSQADNQITVMAGGSFRTGDDMPGFLARTGVRDIHFTALSAMASTSVRQHPEISFDTGSRLVTDADRIREIRGLLAA